MASYFHQARGDTPGSDRLITGTTQQILRASRNSAAVWRRPVPARDALVPAFQQLGPQGPMSDEFARRESALACGAAVSCDRMP
jgi:hypothetical protein